MTPYYQSKEVTVYKGDCRAVLREIAHTVRPDLDNLEKALLDVLTRVRFYEDDSQIFTKSTAKAWGPKPYLAIALKTEAELYGMERT